MSPNRIEREQKEENCHGPFGRGGEVWKTGETKVPGMNGRIIYEN
jgi:hypothetical protein